MPRTLYLGLDPPQGVLHYPVIRTEKVISDALQEAHRLWPEFSHVLFTSKTTVRYWLEERPLFDKVALAIGRATAKRLPSESTLLAEEATQEGVMALVQKVNPAFVFLPQSKRARPLLAEYLRSAKIPFFQLELYDTVLQKLEPVPDLAEFDEIVFTSPSTVDGFLRIFGALPDDKVLTPIGPVTAARLQIGF